MLAHVFATVLVAAAAFAPAPEGLALARSVAAAYASEIHGVRTFAVTTRTEISGGFVHRTDFSETAYVDQDGVAVRKRVLRSVENGKVADAAALAKLSATVDGPLSRYGLHSPGDPRMLTEYRYAAPRETPAGVELAFESDAHDQAHGSGTMLLDPARTRILQITFKPNVLPEHATSATLTIDFGTVMEGRWDVVKITRSFAGRYGIFTGRATATSLYELYRPYGTANAAEEALDAMKPRSG